MIVETLYYREIDRGMQKNIRTLLAGRSAKMKEVYKLINKVAPLSINILLSGEHGTGKDLVAKYIHYKSERSGELNIIDPSKLYNNRVSIDLIDNQITDIFIKSRDGTIIIDDISLANNSFQDSLYRVIKSNEDSNIRVIACTSKDLAELVRKKRFNIELYHLINIVGIHIPALRDRKDDIVDLAEIFLKQLKTVHRLEKQISVELSNLLIDYNYPGNVRELESIITYAYLQSDTDNMLPHHLPNDFGTVEQNQINTRLSDDLYCLARNLLKAGELSDTIDVYSEYRKVTLIPLLKAALDLVGNNKSKAADLINLNRNTVAKMIKDYNIE